MKHKSRRRFLRNSSLAVTGFLIGAPLVARKINTTDSAIACAPLETYKLSGTVASVKSGNWSDPATWGGSLPSEIDTPLINNSHTVVIDVSATVSGLYIDQNAVLKFTENTSVTLQSARNIIVLGKLEMRPSSASFIHTLRFVGINENVYVGGGMDPIDTDTGLWVMGAGSLDLMGAPKMSWTNAASAVSPGASAIAANNTTGWLPGDELCITPTAPASEGAAYIAFEETAIQSLSGSIVSLSKAITYNHPAVYNRWTPEVLNLTRNVRIEGTASGKAHVFIRSSVPQSIRFVQLRYLGPRKDINGDGIKEFVAGRYCIHFHHSMDGSRGSLIEGCVVRNAGSHAYVPHGSHGTTFKNNVAYNVTETAFWWDEGHMTHDTVWDGNIVAKCDFIFQSLDVLNTNEQMPPNLSSNGFLLGVGDGNVANNNVVVGTYGDAEAGGGYNWEANNDGVWEFKNNLAHNNEAGIRVWQVTTRNHVVEDFFAYHNTIGIFHGAYANSYRYNKGILYGNGIHVKASSINSNRVKIENYEIHCLGLIDYGIHAIESPLDGEAPVFVRNTTITGHKIAGICLASNEFLKNLDVIQCEISAPEIYVHPDSSSNEIIRLQGKDRKAYMASKDGKVEIPPFAPEIWGTGNGLKAEYFNSTDFTKQALTRVDSNISFSEWDDWVHHKIVSNVFTARWTGQVQPQFTEPYNFHIEAGGGTRMWVNNQLVIDSWYEKHSDDYHSVAIPMEAGKKYDVKVEYLNTDGQKGMNLYWSSPSLPVEYIPQSQLYSDFNNTPQEPVQMQPLNVVMKDVYTVNPGGKPNTIYVGYGPNTLTLEASVSGGSGDYNFQWPGGGTGTTVTAAASANDVGLHTFNLTVSDTANHTVTVPFTVEVIDVRCGTDMVSIFPSADETNGICVATGQVAGYLAQGYRLGKYVQNQNPVQQFDISVSPNPTTYQFTLRFTGGTNEPILVHVYNRDLYLIRAYPGLNVGSTITFGAGYPKGNYIVAAQQGEVIKSLQLLKI